MFHVDVDTRSTLSSERRQQLTADMQIAGKQSVRSQAGRHMPLALLRQRRPRRWFRAAAS